MPKRQHNNIEDAIKSGGKITEYHQHQNNDNFTAHVKMEAEGNVLAFTNIEPAQMERLLKGHPQAKRQTTRQSGSIDELIESGAKILDTHGHERNDTYTVYVQTSANEPIRVFTNIAEDHLKELQQKGGKGGDVKMTEAQPASKTRRGTRGSGGGVGGGAEMRDFIEKDEDEDDEAEYQEGEGLEEEDDEGEGEEDEGEEDQGTGATGQAGGTRRKRRYGSRPEKFLQFMEQGSKIIDYHPTARGTYSIHLQTREGKIRNFSSLSEDQMRQYAPNFKPGKTVESDA